MPTKKNEARPGAFAIEYIDIKKKLSGIETISTHCNEITVYYAHNLMFSFNDGEFLMLPLSGKMVSLPSRIEGGVAIFSVRIKPCFLEDECIFQATTSVEPFRYQSPSAVSVDTILTAPPFVEHIKMGALKRGEGASQPTTKEWSLTELKKGIKSTDRLSLCLYEKHNISLSINGLSTMLPDFCCYENPLTLDVAANVKLSMTVIPKQHKFSFRAVITNFRIEQAGPNPFSDARRSTYREPLKT